MQFFLCTTPSTPLDVSLVTLNAAVAFLKKLNQVLKELCDAKLTSQRVDFTLRHIVNKPNMLLLLFNCTLWRLNFDQRTPKTSKHLCQ